MNTAIILAQDNGEAFEDLELPSNVEELVKNFSYMSYDVIVIRDDQKRQDSTIEYDYLGKEEVENISTDKVSFKITDSLNNDMPSDMLFWFDGTDIKKMKVEGEIIPAQVAGVMGERVLSAMFSPFYNLSEYDIDTLSKMGKVSHSTEKFGEENIDITIIEVQNIPEYEIESVLTKIGKYKDVSFVLSYNYVSSEEDLEIKFEVNDIKFH